MSDDITSEEIEEQIAFSNVVATFEQYESYALSANHRRRKDYYRLPKADQEYLEKLGYKKKLSAVDDAIHENALFLRKIVADPAIFAATQDVRNLEEGDEEHEDHDHHQSSGPSHSHSHGDGQPHSHSHSHSHSQSHAPGHRPEHRRKRRYRPTPHDVDKLMSTIKQFVRDWSEEGKIERDQCYKPIKEALLKHYSHVPADERSQLRVLTPGAGLARLSLDVAQLGFSCQGNEFSHYMLLPSFFMLNRTDQIHEHTIYPYVHSFSNLPDRDALLRPVRIPDILPSNIPKGVDFSLVAGDFEEIYGATTTTNKGHEPQDGEWDAILTCFFIDTAKNIVNYLRILHRILAPGGVWINMGPLLWHFENNTTNDISVELDLEEVKTLAREIGFDIKDEREIATSYTTNHQSMLSHVYKAHFWTATKRESQ
ncbi:N2227-domain-containing protein [Sistotremastrum niveocremeum HHB9708]|uniref:carnosine N-methyltransferase n=1 Tax=Sistotremastrum niveocremeum HHB9708 TaxID=1314777 RepID=A0A164YG90_9AGAM|nr:N2227-domain-containing protein [Sistotremastrum niveocremeum HHB9708]